MEGSHRDNPEIHPSRLTPEVWQQQLEQMAVDPQIQAELRRIESEFRPTERDGLE
jgi:hypothetical protein